MRIFNHTKIKKKLIACFLIIALFSLVVGVFSLNELSESNRSTADIYNGHLTPSSYLTTVQKNLILIGSNYNLMLFEKDPSKAQQRVDEITAWTTEDKELLLKYEAIPSSENEKEIYAKLQEQLTAYRGIRADLDQYLIENNFDAAQQLVPSFSDARNLVDDSINNLVKENRLGAEEAITKSEKDFHTSRAIILIALFAAIAIGLIFGVIIANSLSRPLNRLVEAAEKLSLGDVDVQKETETNLKDEIGELMVAFRKMAGNIKFQAETAEKIAAGDLSIQITPKSTKDMLGISMASVVRNLVDLVNEAKKMSQSAIEGDLSKRGDAARFNGGYKDIISGFNETMDAIISPLNTAAEYIKHISKGEIPELITEEYKGEFNEIKTSLNTCIQAINLLITDATMLSEAALNGKLNERADVSKHGGDFAKIVDGLNRTLISVVEPLTIAADTLKQIGKGEIPVKITQTYKGDYNAIKDSINACVDGLDALVEGNEMLERMSKNDYSITLDGTYVGIYEKMRHRINNVITSVRDTIDIVTRVADGDLSKLDGLQSIGKRGDNDTLVPSLIKMLENVKMLVEETAMISVEAVEGNLNARGDESKFNGEFKAVVIGINKTLEAIAQPVSEALSILQEISNGNLHSKMAGDYKGSYAEIKDTLNETTDHLKSYVDEISSVLQEIASGNLQQQITANYKGDFVEIKDSLNHIITSLNQVMGGIGDSADQVAAGSRQVSDGSQSLAQGATEQASSVEELSASINELASQTKQNAIRANEANDLSNEAKLHAESGNQQMAEMLASMTEINGASANISKVIKVIDDIAFQTNILALNAAVEAARAGAQGKGFSVVAEEVRNLAARSAEAVKETTALIETSIGKVAAGTRIANDTAEKLSDIVEKIEKAASLINEIARASNEQASGIAQIDKGVEQVAKVVQTNSATSEESAAASEELYSQAESLKAMVSGFKTQRIR